MIGEIIFLGLIYFAGGWQIVKWLVELIEILTKTFQKQRSAK